VLQQELHNAAMRPLLRLEYEQHCCAISGSYLWTTPYAKQQYQNEMKVFAVPERLP
jgi:hypothetical protein